jgi:hypothetical protein
LDLTRKNATQSCPCTLDRFIGKQASDQTEINTNGFSLAQYFEFRKTKPAKTPANSTFLTGNCHSTPKDGLVGAKKGEAFTSPWIDRSTLNNRGF